MESYFLSFFSNTRLAKEIQKVLITEKRITPVYLYWEKVNARILNYKAVTVEIVNFKIISKKSWVKEKNSCKQRKKIGENEFATGVRVVKKKIKCWCNTRDAERIVGTVTLWLSEF